MIKIKFIYTILLLTPVWMIAQTFTQQTTPSLQAISFSETKWADFNNDSMLDLILSGKDDGSNVFTKIYLSDGDTSFTDITLAIPQLHSTSIAISDANNDGWMDFFITGVTATGQKIAQLYQNNTDSTFSAFGNFTPVSDGSVVWFDLNNDGWTDIVLTGIDNNSQRITQVYRNDNGSFAPENTILPALSNGNIAPIDYNLDGRTDLVLAGSTNQGKITNIYENKGHFNFDEITTSMERVSSGDLAVVDIDNDGDQDIVLSGLNHNGDRLTQLYTNNTTVFTVVPTANLDSVSNSSIALADLNTDGLTDILLTGIDNGNIYRSFLYTNNGNNSFTRTSPFTGVFRGQTSIADYDNDDDLDILLTGFSNFGSITELHRNDNLTANTTPSIPTNLSAAITGNQVQLTWNPATDNQTPTNALTYNYYLANLPNSGALHSPLAFINDGKRKVAQQGFSTGFLWLDSLPQGQYYWGAQAIDNGLASSPFSVDSFVVCDPVFIGNDTAVCQFDSLTLQIGTSSDSVNWYSTQTGLLAVDTTTYSFMVAQNDTIYVALTNTLGCTLYDSILITAWNLPTFSLGIDTLLCWGDSTPLFVDSSIWETIEWHTLNTGQLAINQEQVVFNGIATDHIWAYVQDSNHCIYTDSIMIQVAALPVVNAGMDTIVCTEDSVVLGHSPTAQGNGPFQYIWSPGQFLTDFQIANPVAYRDTTTTYALLVIDSNTCANQDSVTIFVNPPSIINPGNDTAICFGERIQLGGNPTATGSNFPYSYTWIPTRFLDDSSLSNPYTLPDTSIVYTLIVGIGNCDPDTAIITVDVYELPIIVAIEDTTIGRDATVQLNAQGGLSYTWIPDYEIQERNSSSPFVSPQVSTTYFVTGIDSNGCSNVDTTIVYVKNDVFVPNLFTPNDDQHNDIFRIYGSGIQTLQLRVFNGFGQLIFESSDLFDIMQAGWDGKFDGEIQENGNYFWQLEGFFYDGSAVSYKGKNSGMVKLIR